MSKHTPLHSAVHRLSCGTVLERFVGCFDAIKAFLAEKGQDYLLIKPDSFHGHEMDLSLIDSLDTQGMEMQLIELKSSALWVTKLTELRETAGNHSWKDHGTSTFCTALPEKFNCLRNVALALLTVFGSTYLCEQIFSHMKNVLSPSRSHLLTYHSEACVQLTLTNSNPQIMELSKGKRGQGLCISFSLTQMWVFS